MSKRQKSKPRITVEVSDELYQEIQELFPWGTLKPTVNTIMKDVVHLMREHDPHLVLGAIMSDDMTLKDFLIKFDSKDKKNKEEKNNGNDQRP